MGRPDLGSAARGTVMSLRVSPSEKARIERQAAARGAKDASGYLRWLINQDAERLRTTERSAQ